MGNFLSVTIDCEEPQRLALFWAAALDGYSTNEGNIIVTSDKGPTLYFQKVPEKKAGKTRIHFDLGAANVDAEVFRLTRNGARVIEEKVEGAHKWTIMADPEGNEFCVCPVPA